MLLGSRGDNRVSDYKNLSLPKQNNQQIRAVSTRSISQFKNDKTDIKINSSVAPVSNPPKMLTFYLGKGNNEGLVRRILKCRGTWIESEDSTSAFINFKWQQDQKGYKYEWLIDSGLCRTVLNQFENHECISNKEYLFKHLDHYCQKNSIDIWKIVPPTYVLNIKDQTNMQILKQFTDSYEKYYPKKLKEKSITDIDKQIQSCKQKFKKIFYNSNLKKILAKSPPIKGCYVDQDGQYLWIVKPTFLNRGRGIQIFSKLETLYKFISQNIAGYVQKSLSKSDHDIDEKPAVIDYIKRNSEQIQQSILYRDPANRQIRERKESENFFDGNQYIRVIPKGPSIIKTDKFLIQKYLQKPLLMFNRKFDIRIWVLVTQNLRCFVFKEGYIRLSSMEYSCKDTKDNTFMHLTNNAVQKFSEGYGDVADGNQLPFSELQKVMEQKGMSFQKCKSQIHQHIKVSLLATTKGLNPLNRKYSFQIFGYDFMIDETGYPWLIEVNNNPCIEQSSKLLGMLLPRMIDDAFRLTLDVLFYGSVSNGKFPVSGYSLNQNMWLNLKINEK